MLFAVEKKFIMKDPDWKAIAPPATQTDLQQAEQVDMHCLAGRATKRAQGQNTGQPECRSLDWSRDSRLW